MSVLSDIQNVPAFLKHEDLSDSNLYLLPAIAMFILLSPGFKDLFDIFDREKGNV